jgi:site-specific DNA-adenine methylase
MAVNYAAKNCIINNLNEYLFSYFWVLSSAKFVKLIEKYPNHSLKPVWEERAGLYEGFLAELSGCARGEVWEKKYKEREDIVGKAIYCLIKNQNNYKHELKFDGAFNYGQPKRKPLGNFQDIVDYSLNNDLRVWNLDFKDALKKINRWEERDNSYTVIYADPPYLSTGTKLYDHYFTEDDTRDLARLLLESEHHAFISELDTGIIREIFDGFNFVNVSWRGQREVLISNRKLTRQTQTTSILNFVKRSKP